MPFRFSLEPLLRLRRSVEHQQELRLAEANALVARDRLGIDQLNGAITAWEEQQTGQMRSGTTAAEIQFSLFCGAGMLHRREEMQKELSHHQEISLGCREALQQARKERETLDTLRERQFRMYEQEEKRREQRRLDDLFLLRREYLRRH